jgi:hypothetical protein
MHTAPDIQETTMLKLRSIHIYERSGFSAGNPLGADGTIDFGGDHGEVKIKLNNEQCQRMIAIVADVAVEYANEISTALKAEIIEQHPALPAPERDDLGTL